MMRSIKNKKKLMLIVTIFIISIMSLIVFKPNKKVLYNQSNNLFAPKLGDISSYLFNSTEVGYKNNDTDIISTDVQNVIDELHKFITGGCYVGYTKGTDNGTTYVCNKDNAAATTKIFDSKEVTYDNSESGLLSNNVQDALTEVYLLVGEKWCIDNYSKQNETSSSYECRINTQPSTLTVTNSSVALTYNGSSANNTYSYNGDGEISCSSSDTSKVTCSVDTANTRITVTPVAATSTNVTITVSATATANYYAPTAATFTVSVAPIEATCPTTITGSTTTYNGSAQTITVSGGANGTTEYSTDNSTWSTTKPTRTAAGTTTVYVREYATGNYTTKTCGSANIVINPAAASFSCSNKTYNGSSQTACTCTNCTLGGAYSATNAGSYTATATPNTNYTLSTTSIGWTMAKITNTVTLKVGGGGSGSYTFTASCTNGSPSWHTGTLNNWRSFGTYNAIIAITTQSASQRDQLSISCPAGTNYNAKTCYVYVVPTRAINPGQLITGRNATIGTEGCK